MPRCRVGRNVAPERRRQLQLMNFSHRKWCAVIWQPVCGNNGHTRKLPKWLTSVWHHLHQPKSPNTFRNVIVGTSVTLRHGNRSDWKSECRRNHVDLNWFCICLNTVIFFSMQHDHRKNSTTECTPRRRQAASLCAQHAHEYDASACKIGSTTARRKIYVGKMNEAAYVAKLIVRLIRNDFLKYVVHV